MRPTAGRMHAANIRKRLDQCRIFFVLGCCLAFTLPCCGTCPGLLCLHFFSCLHVEVRLLTTCYLLLFSKKKSIFYFETKYVCFFCLRCKVRLLTTCYCAFQVGGYVCVDACLYAYFPVYGYADIYMYFLCWCKVRLLTTCYCAFQVGGYVCVDACMPIFLCTGMHVRMHSVQNAFCTECIHASNAFCICLSVLNVDLSRMQVGRVHLLFYTLSWLCVCV